MTESPEMNAGVTAPGSTEAKAQAKASRKWFQKKRFIIPIAVVALIVIISAASGGGKKGNTTSAGAGSASQSQAAESDSRVLPSETPTPTLAPKPEVPAEYRSALRKAESYSETLHMSKAGIYDQLVSEYGEQFSAEAAQYAIDNMVADWNENALAKAKSYQDTMNMSPSAIWDQLTSEYGEQFTAEEADYAIAHLND